jgi:hypothetical protein
MKQYLDIAKGFEEIYGKIIIILSGKVCKMQSLNIITLEIASYSFLLFCPNLTSFKLSVF